MPIHQFFHAPLYLNNHQKILHKLTYFIIFNHKIVCNCIYNGRHLRFFTMQYTFATKCHIYHKRQIYFFPPFPFGLIFPIFDDNSLKILRTKAKKSCEQRQKIVANLIKRINLKKKYSDLSFLNFLRVSWPAVGDPMGSHLGSNSCVHDGRYRTLVPELLRSRDGIPIPWDRKKNTSCDPMGSY